MSGTCGKLLAAFQGVPTDAPPIWLMRQAGRYLPEYRETRRQAGSFLDLCYNSKLAAEVTLQPIRRFDFDAAILFADILLVPHALGQEVAFVENEGPRLNPVKTLSELEAFRGRNIHERLAPVYETVREVRKALATDKALIGFAGAPWTVATYMLAGEAIRDPASLRAQWRRDPQFVTALIDLLTDATIEYLIAQLNAGADVVQLFDTWAGGLPEDALTALSIKPLKRISRAVKTAKPGAPVIFFPKGVGAFTVDYAKAAECDAIGIDFATPWRFARNELSPHATVQGGLDPMLVVGGGAPMEKAARELVETFRGAPYIFNLGHGLTPDTPPENVARLVEIVREGTH